MWDRKIGSLIFLSYIFLLAGTSLKYENPGYQNSTGHGGFKLPRFGAIAERLRVSNISPRTTAGSAAAIACRLGRVDSLRQREHRASVPEAGRRPRGLPGRRGHRKLGPWGRAVLFGQALSESRHLRADHAADAGQVSPGRDRAQTESG